ncbi:MAG: hypothetical protein CVU73_13575 [Deltaproteobacteria bacterium HGW-Deltaproteobacteria-8]|jgi:hypothetical protein|nr:MAG: hypothetical protein CVU73_13575 [Deltaproteobacteria bacterium HGW-Deltaproteobacteria-8]
MHSPTPLPGRLRTLAGAARRYLFCIAPLPHATGSFSVVLGAGLAHFGVELLAQGALAAGLCLALPATGWLGLGLLCLADGYCRYREYRRLKRMMSRWGFHPRLLVPVAASRCQRDAALAAATETGHQARAQAHFRKLGYRWYHLLPDRTVENPLRFFDPAFLRVTFLPGKQ